MKYFHFIDKFGKLRNADTWVELDRGFVLRQISILNDEVLASNRPHPNYGYHLPTGYIDYAAYNQIHADDIARGLIKPVVKVTPEKFDAVWQKHLDKHQAIWLSTKNEFQLETVARGSVQAFYPQGVIIRLENNVTGIANYDRCREIFGHTLIPNMPVQVTVGGYNERMQWLILIEPQTAS
ncbi:MAG: hypothetical protein AAGD96_28880 [Chloroflexota bacterium]